MTKGLLLAAGRDDQLWLSRDIRSSQLVSIANKPILYYGLEGLREAGVVEVGVVVCPATSEEIREAVGDGEAWGLRVTYINPGEPLGVVHAVLAAEEFLGEDPFVVHCGDCLLRQSIRPFVDRLNVESLDAVLLLQEAAGARGGAVVELEDARVLRLVEKTAAPASNVTLVGVHLFGPSFLQAARKTSPSWRGALEITDAIEHLIAGGGQVRTEVVDSWRRVATDPDDLLEANRVVLDDLEPDFSEAGLTNTRIQGRVVIDKTAVLDSTVVRGPAIIGAGVRLSDAYIGPYTSIGDNVVVDGAEIENSIILRGAIVKNLGSRMEASIVGSQSKVVRDFAFPTAMRLCVGQDAEVSLI